MTRTIAYIRVSLDKQADRGISLDVQRHRVEAYAALYDLELVEVIEDAGESAKSLERPGLQRALDLLACGHAEALLVAKLDRLTRSVRDLDTLLNDHFKSDRCALLAVGEQIDTRSASGRLVLNVLASVSQWEREAIGERTSAALRMKRSRGEYIGGGVPYGFALREDGVNLTEVPAEQAIIKKARTARLRGWSYRKIGRVLAAEGHLTRGGRAWDAKQVARMVSG